MQALLFPYIHRPNCSLIIFANRPKIPLAQFLLLLNTLPLPAQPRQLSRIYSCKQGQNPAFPSTNFPHFLSGSVAWALTRATGLEAARGLRTALQEGKPCFCPVCEGRTTLNQPAVELVTAVPQSAIGLSVSALLSVPLRPEIPSTFILSI